MAAPVVRVEHRERVSQVEQQLLLVLAAPVVRVPQRMEED
jgi:hypothetical protein